MASVSLKKVSKRFGDITAVENLTLEIEDCEFFSLLGPSGAGKTTILRMIAGVEKPDKGNIYIDDIPVNDVPPREREVAMVFQSYALFPHKTVYENMAYPLRKRKMSEADIKRIVEETAEILHIKPLLERLPRQLSGGERQRIGLGRTMVRQPKVFLFDEPLTNLDAKLRVEMRGEFKKICSNLKATVIYATPDQLEAVTMANRIAVLDKGMVLRCDSPDELYNNPKNLFVAGFIGSPAMNFISCTLTEEKEKAYLDAAEFRYEITDIAEKIKLRMTGSKVILGVRPEHIKISRSMKEGYVQLEVFVLERVRPEIIVDLKAGEKIIKALAPAEFYANIGDKVWVGFEKIFLFDERTGEEITGGVVAFG